MQRLRRASAIVRVGGARRATAAVATAWRVGDGDGGAHTAVRSDAAYRTAYGASRNERVRRRSSAAIARRRALVPAQSVRQRPAKQSRRSTAAIQSERRTPLSLRYCLPPPPPPHEQSLVYDVSVVQVCAQSIRALQLRSTPSFSIVRSFLLHAIVHFIASHARVANSKLCGCCARQAHGTSDNRAKVKRNVLTNVSMHRCASRLD